MFYQRETIENLISKKLDLMDQTFSIENQPNARLKEKSI
jgi:hypothetical protein